MTGSSVTCSKLPDLTSRDGETWLKQILADMPQLELSRLGLSLGLAQYLDDGTDLETLVRVAGLAALSDDSAQA